MQKIKAAITAAVSAAVLAGGFVGAPAAHAQDNGRHYDRNDNRDNNRYDRNDRNRQDWSDLSGQPYIRTGRESGFFIWRTGNTVHIATTDTNNGNNRYKGEITIDKGHFNNVTREGKSKNNSDKLERPQTDRITFDFNTQTDRDGMRFDVVDGDRLTFRLSRDGKDGDRVYFGSNKRRVSGDAIVVDLRDNNRRNDNNRNDRYDRNDNRNDRDRNNRRDDRYDGNNRRP